MHRSDSIGFVGRLPLESGGGRSSGPETDTDGVRDASKQPPLADRGVATHVNQTHAEREPYITSFGKLVGAGVDYLTVSMSGAVAASWRAVSKFEEEGKPTLGFDSSERWVVMGGKGWRRFNPRQASKLWGLDYESWDFDGGNSRFPAVWFRGRDARPSRVDIAWDFEVADSLTSDHVAESWRSHAEHQGISLGIAGQGGDNTRYFGARESERRIKIYRRDFKHPSLAFDRGPVLRVELTLKGDAAAAWWIVWSVDETQGLAAAAAHVEAMTGGRVQRDLVPVPQLLDIDPATDAAQQLFQFVSQHAGMINAAADAGVDIFGLAARKSATWCRETRWRHTERVRLMVAAGSERIESIVAAMLAGHTAASAASEVA